MTFELLALLMGADVPARSVQCELHVWPTREFGAIFHGAKPSGYLGEGQFEISMYTSPMDQVREEMGRALSPETQSRIIQSVIPPASSALVRYKIIVHEAPVKSRFANFIDKHVGDGPREVNSSSPCYAELHLVALTAYKTALYGQLQTIYVFRNFGASQQAVKSVGDAARTSPPKVSGPKGQSVQADVHLQASFSNAIRKILSSRKLGF